MNTDQLPKEMFRFFWDVDVSNINPEKDKQFIVERALEYGDAKSVEWLFAMYKESEIMDILKISQKLSPKSANYWALKLGVPKDEVKCLNQQSPNKQNTIWKY